MSTTDLQWRSFRLAWQEYELMVHRILPRFAEGALTDLGDDLDHMLFCRSEIERVFDKCLDDRRLMPYRTSVIPLDAELLLQRKQLLARLSSRHLAASRRRNDLPRSHWWWYLDEVDTEASRDRSLGDAGLRKLAGTGVPTA